MGAARQSLGARLWGAPAILAGGVVGSVLDGAFGASLGLAAASWLDAVLVWTAYRRAVRAPAAEPNDVSSADETPVVY
jgi:hypothetical protein